MRINTICVNIKLEQEISKVQTLNTEKNELILLVKRRPGFFSCGNFHQTYSYTSQDSHIFTYSPSPENSSRWLFPEVHLLYWADSEGHSGWNLDSIHPQNTNSYEAWKSAIYSERETFQAIFLPALINLATTLASQEDESCLILLSRAELFNKVGESAQTGYARPNYWQKHTVHHGNKQKSAAKM